MGAGGESPRCARAATAATPSTCAVAACTECAPAASPGRARSCPNLPGVRRAILLAAAAVCLAGGVPAPASAALSLSADRPETGSVPLTVGGGQQGPTVTFHEQVSGHFQLITRMRLTSSRAVLPDAATWLCERRARLSVATEYTADATPEQDFASIRTPPCRHRFSITFRPRRYRVGRRIRVR